MFYEPGGSARLTLPARALVDDGSWRIADDALCSAFPKLDAGTARCRTVFELAEGKYRTADDMLSWY